MIQYILECIAFQLAFLIVYDLFLKKETFFQWNRVYLIGSYALSLLLPVIKIGALKTNIPEDFMVYPEDLWQQDFSGIVITETANHWFWNMSIENKILYGGMLISLLLFGYKLKQIRTLRAKGEVYFFKKYTKVLMKKSTAAFSFFKTIFIGDQIKEEDYESILEHELVHIKQRHTYDLLFFEFMRIIGWFNPLVYLYQKRIAEVHEFIADEEVSKDHKMEQYQLLLSQVFQTENISFINTFFKSSIIKKRIVMLQKSKSSRSSKLKYLMLVPLIVGMLFYTSCETRAEKKNKVEGHNVSSSTDNEGIPFAVVDEVPEFPGCENEGDKRDCFNTMIQTHISKNFKYPFEAQEKGIQGRVSVLFTISKTGEITGVRTRGPHELLENEAKRIINRLPVMKPGVHKGEAVNVPFSIPIQFKLKLNDSFKEKSEDIKVLDNSFIKKMKNPPLVLVDGTEISKEEMEKIETSTIASVNVLKDESATEKYGDKGKNGVIEITLKK